MSFLHFVGISKNLSKLFFSTVISYSKYLRICGEKLKFTANPQSNRQCCLFCGKTAWKKWMLLFSGLEVNVQELMTFFFGRSMSGHHEDIITVNIVV